MVVKDVRSTMAGLRQGASRRSMATCIMRGAVLPGSWIASRALSTKETWVWILREVSGQQSTIDAKGVLVLDSGGCYTLRSWRPTFPKVASNNRMTATPEEAKAIVAATAAHFGTYSVSDKNLVFKIE